jgi:predicted dehydrogenase
VLVEKPVALRSGEAERLAAAASRARTLCMPAMCMRFWPGWDWLRARVAERTFGAVRSAVFRRVGARPDWSAFYRDEARSGGALFDLHIHDADFVRWCFGAPDAVASHGTREHLTTAYVYDGGPPHVVAEGGWDLSDGFDFEMAFTVAFEGATADFELGRAPELLLAQGGESVAVPLAEGTGWDAEVVHLLDAIARGAPAAELRATLPEAVELTRMLEAEAQSLRTGQAVRLG